MDVVTHIAALETAGMRMADAAAAAGPDAPVPGCPGWRVADLVTHMGGVHRWATAYVTTGRMTETSDEEDRAFFAPSEDLVGWLADGVRALAAALRSAPADLACWTFLPAPSPLAFWARRQAHETTVHCADAEAAADRPTVVEAALGADGLEELLCGFFARPGRGPRADPPVALGLVPTDAATRWTVRIGPAGPVARTGDGRGDCVVSGRAGDLYLAMWNRTPPGELAVAGDRSVLERWQDGATVTWT